MRSTADLKMHLAPLRIVANTIHTIQVQQINIRGTMVLGFGQLNIARAMVSAAARLDIFRFNLLITVLLALRMLINKIVTMVADLFIFLTARTPVIGTTAKTAAGSTAHRRFINLLTEQALAAAPAQPKVVMFEPIAVPQEANVKQSQADQQLGSAFDKIALCVSSFFAD